MDTVVCEVKETSVTSGCLPSLIFHVAFALQHSYFRGEKQENHPSWQEVLYAPVRFIQWYQKSYCLIWKINEHTCATLLLLGHQWGSVCCGQKLSASQKHKGILRLFFCSKSGLPYTDSQILLSADFSFTYLDLFLPCQAILIQQ